MKVQAFLIGAFAALAIAGAVPAQDDANVIQQRKPESNKYCGGKDEHCSADDQCCSVSEARHI